MNICKIWQFLGKLLSCLLQLLVSMTTFFLEIMILRYTFSKKNKNILKSFIVLELLHSRKEYFQFLAIFRQIFVSFTTAVGSMNSLQLEFIVLRYVFPKETKICWKIQWHLNYCIVNRNICNFRRILSKYLPHSLQLLVLWPLFCLKS